MYEFRIVWATINPEGQILTSSEQLQVKHTGTGIYTIQFETPFKVLPTVVGSQVLYGGTNENPCDNVVFPLVDQTGLTAVTGDSGGNHVDRNFAFMAIGI